MRRSADKIARCVADLTLQLFVIMLCHFLFLRCLVNCGLKVVPQVKLSIQSQCQGSLCSNISSYEWILYEQSSSSANNGIWIRKQHLQLITDTPLGSSNIVIKKRFPLWENKLPPGIVCSNYRRLTRDECIRHIHYVSAYRGHMHDHSLQRHLSEN